MASRTNYQKLYFEGLTKHINAQFSNVHDDFDRIQEKMDEMISHQKETNNRITKLEKETVIFRWASRHPVYAILLIIIIIAGAVTITALVGFENIIKAMI